MRSIPLAATLALTSIFLWSYAALAVDNPGTETNEAAPAPIINTICPMDGKAIDPANCHTVTVTAGAGLAAKQFCMACCSQSCSDTMKNEPLKVTIPHSGKNSSVGPKTMYK